MRISCHSHVFNFRTAFTPKTLNILGNRFMGEQVPDALNNRVTELLRGWLDEGGDVISGEKLTHKLLESVTSSKFLGDLVGKLTESYRVKLEVVNSEKLIEAGIKDITDRLRSVVGTWSDALHDGEEWPLEDFLNFVYIGLQPSIDAVTDHLLDQLESDDVTVPLALDVTLGGTDDGELYREQLNGTSRQVLRHPGRVLPFVCVNAKRDDHFDIMERALTSQGFVGVKIYPSMGYEPDTVAMNKVFAYCTEHAVPVLMHCSRGGFYESDRTKDYANPARLRPILKRHQGLKICLAHFGGGGLWVKDPMAESSWATEIMDLMGEFSGVYTDISHHTNHMEDEDKKAVYFGHLEKWIGDPVVGRRILFGTDYFVVRRVLSARHFWEHFEANLQGESFKLMTLTNPCAFLGLPGESGAGLEWNMSNYVDFVAANAEHCDTAPIEWLQKAVAERYGDTVTFHASPLGARWSENNTAHKLLYALVSRQMDEKARKDCPFARAGGVHVRRLQYWNKEFEAPDIHEEKCKSLARSIDSQFMAVKAEYESGMTQTKACRQLATAFHDGSVNLAKLGGLCDDIYRMPAESGG